MSSFKVEVVAIDAVINHPGADRLDIAKIRGFDCLVGRDQWRTGDQAIYVPIDSVLPEALVKSLGIEKFYSKKVKAVRLRQVFSMGLLIKPLEGMKIGDDVAEILGITKWEETIPVEMRGIMAPRDERFVQYTDIENVKNYPNVFTPADEVIITEKYHGTNCRMLKIATAFASDGIGELLVGSHRCNLIEAESNLYWRAAVAINAKEKLLPGEQIFCEIIGPGIQDLTYGVKSGEIRVVIFDVMRDEVFLSYADAQIFMESKGWSHLQAAVLHSGPWSNDLLKYASGNSIMDHSQIREGVVIKPLVESFDCQLQGRKILKAISESYLLRKDTNATERH